MLRPAVLVCLAIATPLATSARAESTDDVRHEWLGGRPPECDPTGRANVWERTKAPELAAYCAQLSEGAALLVGSSDGRPVNPGGAEIAANQADKLLPNHAAPAVLLGRSLVERGKAKEGVAALLLGKQRDARALADPAALLALARGQAELGEMDDARASYAELLPRAASLPLRDRGAAFFEAALLSFGQGQGHAEEATLRMREAVRGGQDTLRSVAIAGLALALDRTGREDEGLALLADRGVPRADAFDDARVRASFTTAAATGEAKAMQAVAFEAAHETEKARAAWKAYLEAAPNGPWHEEAEAHLAGRHAKAGKP